MSQNLPVIVIEIFLFFGGVLALYIWQMRDLKREKEKREREETDRKKTEQTEK